MGPLSLCSFSHEIWHGRGSFRRGAGRWMRSRSRDELGAFEGVQTARRERMRPCGSGCADAGSFSTGYILPPRQRAEGRARRPKRGYCSTVRNRTKPVKPYVEMESLARPHSYPHTNPHEAPESGENARKCLPCEANRNPEEGPRYHQRAASNTPDQQPTPRPARSTPKRIAPVRAPARRSPARRHPSKNPL